MPKPDIFRRSLASYLFFLVTVLISICYGGTSAALSVEDLAKLTESRIAALEAYSIAIDRSFIRVPNGSATRDEAWKLISDYLQEVSQHNAPFSSEELAKRLIDGGGSQGASDGYRLYRSANGTQVLEYTGVDTSAHKVRVTGRQYQVSTGASFYTLDEAISPPRVIVSTEATFPGSRLPAPSILLYRFDNWLNQHILSEKYDPEARKLTVTFSSGLTIVAQFSPEFQLTSTMSYDGAGILKFRAWYLGYGDLAIPGVPSTRITTLHGASHSAILIEQIGPWAHEGADRLTGIEVSTSMDVVDFRPGDPRAYSTSYLNLNLDIKSMPIVEFVDLLTTRYLEREDSLFRNAKDPF